MPREKKAAAPNVGLNDLPAVLSALLVADNDVRGQAESALKKLGKDPTIVLALLEQLRANPDTQVNPAPPTRNKSSIFVRRLS